MACELGPRPGGARTQELGCGAALCPSRSAPGSRSGRRAAGGRLNVLVATKKSKETGRNSR